MAETIIFLTHWKTGDFYEIEVRTSNDNGYINSFRARITEKQFAAMTNARQDDMQNIYDRFYVKIDP